MTSAADVDLLLHYMPIIMRSGGISDWERNFCISVVGAGKRRAFTPSAKQIAVMQRIVDGFRESTMRHDDDVTERGNGIG